MKKEISPVPVIVAVVLIVGVLAYVFWLRPMQQEAKIKQEWNTEAAAEKRGPGRAMSAGTQAKLRDLLAKEGKGEPRSRGGANRE